MDRLRTAVVGVGHHGYHHARILAALDGVDLVGVLDTDSRRGKEVAEEFDTTFFDNVDALVQTGVDAVSIAAPTTAHFELGERFLRAGVDVLIEKPLASTLEEARNIVALAEAEKRFLQVGHIERFNGAVLALFDSIQRPEFIECHRLSPYPNRGDDVSVVMDLMVHDLDIVLALDGTEVVSVDAIGVSVFSQFEDIANARIRFSSGCVANVTCSRISVERMRKIRIFERDSYVSTDYSQQEVLVYRKKAGRLEGDMTPMDMISVEPLVVKREEPLRLELESFVHCVRHGKPPLCSGEDGVAAMELADQIMKTIREGK